MNCMNKIPILKKIQILLAIVSLDNKKFLYKNNAFAQIIIHRFFIAIKEFKVQLTEDYVRKKDKLVDNNHSVFDQIFYK